MVSPAILVVILFLTSMIMAIAMGLIWLLFGRERHVALWTGSYLASALQWIANALGLQWHDAAWLYVSGVLMIASAALSYAGILRRGAYAGWAGRLGWSAVAMAAGAGAVVLVAGPNIAVAFLIPTYVAVLMVQGARAVHPRHRRLSGTEWPYFVMLVTFVAFELALIAAGFGATALQSPVGLWLYRMILGWGLPPLFVAIAIAAIIMVAGDAATRLAGQALIDPLTGALNRRGFDQRARDALTQARRQARPLTIAMCDLDGFKQLNDSHGHPAGDAALRRFVGLLDDKTRDHDVVGRLGGDEFALLLPDTWAPDAIAILDRVTNVLAADTPLPMRFSFGIATTPDGCESLDTLIARADAELYRAKHQRRGTPALRVITA